MADRVRVGLYFNSHIILVEILVVELLPLGIFRNFGGVGGF
jgi:hypothetical protein